MMHLSLCICSVRLVALYLLSPSDKCLACSYSNKPIDTQRHLLAPVDNSKTQIEDVGD